jgi:hypothetical protein
MLTIGLDYSDRTGFVEARFYANRRSLGGDGHDKRIVSMRRGAIRGQRTIEQLRPRSLLAMPQSDRLRLRGRDHVPHRGFPLGLRRVAGENLRRSRTRDTAGISPRFLPGVRQRGAERARRSGLYPGRRPRRRSRHSSGATYLRRLQGSVVRNHRRGPAIRTASEMIGLARLTVHGARRPKAVENAVACDAGLGGRRGGRSIFP